MADSKPEGFNLIISALTEMFGQLLKTPAECKSWDYDENSRSAFFYLSARAKSSEAPFNVGALWRAPEVYQTFDVLSVYGFEVQDIFLTGGENLTFVVRLFPKSGNDTVPGMAANVARLRAERLREMRKDFEMSLSAPWGRSEPPEGETLEQQEERISGIVRATAREVFGGPAHIVKVKGLNTPAGSAYVTVAVVPGVPMEYRTIKQQFHDALRPKLLDWEAVLIMNCATQGTPPRLFVTVELIRGNPSYAMMKLARGEPCVKPIRK